MKYRLGPNSGDSMMADIHAAARAGHFDERGAAGPSKLETMSVEKLYERVSTMSLERRRLYLAQIGRVRHGRTLLSSDSAAHHPKRSKRTRLADL